jgi:plasmid stability protein
MQAKSPHKAREMPTSSVTIRHVPRPVLESLRERAREHRRSLQGELLAVLEAAAATPAPNRTPAEHLAALRRRGVATEADAVASIRADRNAR